MNNKSFTVRLSITDNSDNSQLLKIEDTVQRDIRLVELIKKTIPGWQTLVDIALAAKDTDE